MQVGTMDVEVDWKKTYKRLTLYAYHRLGRVGMSDMELAEDLAQEAVCRLYDPEYADWDSEREPVLLRFLGSTINGMVSNRRRKATRRGDVLLGSLPCDGENIPRFELSTEERLILRDEVACAVAELRERLAGDELALQVLKNSLLDGDRPQEQAIALGVDVMKVYRARRRLRVAVESMDGETMQPIRWSVWASVDEVAELGGGSSQVMQSLIAAGRRHLYGRHYATREICGQLELRVELFDGEEVLGDVCFDDTGTRGTMMSIDIGPFVEPKERKKRKSRKKQSIDDQLEEIRARVNPSPLDWEAAEEEYQRERENFNARRAKWRKPVPLPPLRLVESAKEEAMSKEVEIRWSPKGTPKDLERVYGVNSQGVPTARLSSTHLIDGREMRWSKITKEERERFASLDGRSRYLYQLELKPGDPEVEGEYLLEEAQEESQATAVDQVGDAEGTEQGATLVVVHDEHGIGQQLEPLIREAFGGEVTVVAKEVKFGAADAMRQVADQAEDVEELSDEAKEFFEDADGFEQGPTITANVKAAKDLGRALGTAAKNIAAGMAQFGEAYAQLDAPTIVIEEQPAGRTLIDRLKEQKVRSALVADGVSMVLAMAMELEERASLDDLDDWEGIFREVLLTSVAMCGGRR